MTTPSKMDWQVDEYAMLGVEQTRSAPTQILTPGRLSETLAMLKDPASLAAEQYRLLAHTMEKQRLAEGGTIIAVSSAVAGEGKTVTSTNLAFALAESKGTRVALCDLDLRGGRVSDVLGLDDLPGISDVLQEKRPASEILRRVDKNLAFLPSGKAVSHPLGLLRSSGWKTLVTSLRGNFNFVIFDCPPVCMSDDMLVIDDVVDKVLLVVRSGFSKAEEIRDAVARITGPKLAGFVLNDAPMEVTPYRTYKKG